MRAVVGIVAAFFAVNGVASVQTAEAVEYNYPWCTSGAMQEYGAVNCGFSTFEQCLATARGNGQSCGPNPHYVPPMAKPAVPKRKLKKTSR